MRWADVGEKTTAAVRVSKETWWFGFAKRE